MEHDYEYDLCVVGPGRIGLPWAAVMADEGFNVVCVDIDEEVVEQINRGSAPFHEPGMEEKIEAGREEGNLRATTEKDAVRDAKIVGFTLNAPESELDRYVDIIEDYGRRLSPDQVILNRTTLPISHVIESRDTFAETIGGDQENLNYVTFPERLAEGKAIQEINDLPKIVGTESDDAFDAVKWLTKSLSGDVKRTDHKTAMFVKLIDNTYRDARFAIANQFAFTAEEIGVDAHEAIQLANEEYGRNNIPTPGTVGGKCLVKDPHFLMDKSLTEQPETPDLFHYTRKTNHLFNRLVFDKVVEQRPQSVGILGTAFKANVGDEFESPAIKLKDRLEDVGYDVSCFDPEVPRGDFESVMEENDVVVLAVNHDFFSERKDKIRENVDGMIVDVWGVIDGENVERVGR